MLLYIKCFFSTIMIGVGIFSFGGYFELDLTSYAVSMLYIYFWSFHDIALSYVWWMVYGWMAWSGLLILVAKCVGKFSLPGGGLIILFFAL